MAKNKLSEQIIFYPEDKEIFPPFRDQGISPPGVEEDMPLKPRLIHKDYKASEKLKSKKALVTGGDSGIGRAICLHFAMEGADVAFTYLSEESKDAEETKSLVESQGGKAFAIQTDLGETDAASQVVKDALKSLGSIDILVNNAAYQNHLEDIDSLSVDQFEHTLNINLSTYFRMVKATLPHMPKNSCIINTSSILGYVGDDRLIDYSAAKGGVHTLTKSLAKSLKKRKIRVNSVAPGPVWTPLNPAERKAEDMKDFGADTIFGRPAQPAEIAPAYVFLASSITGGYITGETINIFGDVSGGN